MPSWRDNPYGRERVPTMRMTIEDSITPEIFERMKDEVLETRYMLRRILDPPWRADETYHAPVKPPRRRVALPPRNTNGTAAEFNEFLRSLPRPTMEEF